MRRTVIPELLDGDLGTQAEVAESLADLHVVNMHFGGTGTTVALLRRVAAECDCRELSVLEVGAADGDLPLEAQRRLAARGIELRLTFLDRMSSHLDGSAAASVCGNALQLPFRDGAFDVVSCALLAHHLEPDELLRYAIEALRVCRRAVLINDLIRSRWHLWLVYAGLPLFRSRLTRHDAPASVSRAYTIEEMRRVLQASPAARITITKHYLCRMGVLLWKEATERVGSGSAAL